MRNYLSVIIIVALSLAGAAGCTLPGQAETEVQTEAAKPAQAKPAEQKTTAAPAKPAEKNKPALKPAPEPKSALETPKPVVPKPVEPPKAKEKAEAPVIQVEQPGQTDLAPRPSSIDPLALYAAAVTKLRQGDQMEGVRLLRQGLELNPDSSWLHLELAKVYFRQKKEDLALDHAESALEINPDLVDAWLITARIYSGRKELLKAIDAYENALELDPDRHEARLFLGLILWEDGQLDDALAALEELSQRIPAHGPTRVYLAQILIQQKKYELAANQLDKALEFNPRYLPALFELARLHELTSKESEAERVYLEILKLDPNSAKGHDLLGRLYLNQGKSEKALHQFALVKGLSDDDVEVKIKLGLVYYEMEQYEKAADEFKLILEKEPNNQRARYYLGVSMQDASKTEEALAAFRAIPEDDEFFIDGVLHQAEIMDAAKDRAGALKLLQDNIDKFPEEPDLLVAYASLQEADKNFVKAEKFLRHALKIEPANAETNFRLGVVLDKQKRRKEGIKLMRKAIELDDRHARALNYIGYTLVEDGGDLEEAERLIRRALAVQPYAGFILDSLGWLYYQRAQYDQAYTYLKRAVEAGGTDPVIYEHVGDVSLKLDNFKEALDYYGKALDKTQQDEMKKRLMNKLKAVRTKMNKKGGGAK